MLANMETDDRRGDAAPPPTAAEARAALAGLHGDSARLADLVVTPPWYHPVLGLVVAAFIGAQAVPGPLSLLVLAGGAALLAVLVIVYRQRFGVWVSQPAGRRSRAALWTIVAVYLVLFAAGTAVQLAQATLWWALIPAALGFVLTIVLGRRYDALLRGDLARRGEPA
jgi:hypothetical protein